MDTSDRFNRARDRMVNRLSGSDGIGRAELIKLADSNNYRRGATDLDQAVIDGIVERISNGKYQLTPQARRLRYEAQTPAGFRACFTQEDWEKGERIRHRENARNREKRESKSEPLICDRCGRELEIETFWTAPDPTPEPIPAGEAATIAEIPLPAQPFAWQPQVWPNPQPWVETSGADFWASSGEPAPASFWA